MLVRLAALRDKLKSGADKAPVDVGVGVWVSVAGSVAVGVWVSVAGSIAVGV